MNLNDKVVIVTGAGSGIGATTAIELVKAGANVAIVGRREDKLKTIAERCATIGKEVLVIGADVAKEEDAKRIVQATVDKFGKLDVLVNNAGIIRSGSICSGDVLGAYDQVMNTNLRAVLHLTTLAAPHLTKTKGNVINISSSITAALKVSEELYIYSISKVALNHFTKLAASELASRDIRVNCISPGPVETDIFVNGDIPWDWDEIKKLTALNRVAQPEEIAELVIFLASDKARSVTGANYAVDNGFLLK